MVGDIKRAYIPESFAKLRNYPEFRENYFEIDMWLYFYQLSFRSLYRYCDKGEVGFSWKLVEKVNPLGFRGFSPCQIWHLFSNYTNVVAVIWCTHAFILPFYPHLAKSGKRLLWTRKLKTLQVLHKVNTTPGELTWESVWVTSFSKLVLAWLSTWASRQAICLCR